MNGTIGRRSDAETDAWVADAAAEAGGGGFQPMTLLDALRIARATVSELTQMPLDGIAASEIDSDGGWRIVIEVVESAARMGENDLLAAHEIRIGPDGAPRGITRLRRYRREEGDIS